MAGEPTPVCTVEIAVLSYRRPVDLAAILPMLSEQITQLRISDTDFAVRVVVVDNDHERSGATVAAAAGRSVRYVNEPSPGIAAARNRALLEARSSDVLIFIDDDERPQPGWLASLLRTYRLRRPTAVVGAVVSEFAGELDPWIAEGGFFTRLRHPTGTEVHIAATNNLLLDLRQVRRMGLTFDERFGESGGSDTLFSRQLVARGGRMEWCDEAVVVDMVPSTRMTRTWVLRRWFRSGNTMTRTSLHLADTRVGRLGARLRMVLLGAARVAGGLLRFVAGVATSSTSLRARGCKTMARGAGMMSGATGYVFREYRRPSVQSSTVSGPHVDLSVGNRRP